MSVQKLEEINQSGARTSSGRPPSAWRPSTSTRRARSSATRAPAWSLATLEFRASPRLGRHVDHRRLGTERRDGRQGASRRCRLRGRERPSSRATRWRTKGHAYGVGRLQTTYVAHATGTHTNSRSDLTVAHAARRAAAVAQGYRGQLPLMSVGAPKALGDGHTMGETGLKAVGEAIQYVLGQPAVGIPTLRRIDREIGPVTEHFLLSAEPSPGNPGGGASWPRRASADSTPPWRCARPRRGAPPLWDRHEAAGRVSRALGRGSPRTRGARGPLPPQPRLRPPSRRGASLAGGPGGLSQCCGTD